MEYLGVFAFVMVLCYMGLPGQVRQLESKVKKLNKMVSNNIKGENVNSLAISESNGTYLHAYNPPKNADGKIELKLENVEKELIAIKLNVRFLKLMKIG